MGSGLGKLKKNMEGMDRRKKLEYIRGYYWYHILGIMAGVCLIAFLLVHFAFAERTPEFSCAIINQKTDYERDEKLSRMFQKQFADQKVRVAVDSDYQLSYKGKRLEDANEGLFEKFFLKWSNGELQAVIATEDFLSYCVDSGGTFYSVSGWDTEGLRLYEKNGVFGVYVSGTELEQYVDNGGREELILAFPKEGGNRKACQKLLDACR